MTVSDSVIASDSEAISLLLKLIILYIQWINILSQVIICMIRFYGEDA
jgi:hypothetical protein